MPKNVVVCCDGTGNEIEENLSNVLKTFRILLKNDEQRVFYDPGIGTLGERDAWGKLRQNANAVFGLATGRGLDENVLDGYRFLVDQYEDGDRIYLFGFSRGAYTVRVLAGFMHMMGLLRPDQVNIAGYALAAYKRAGEDGDFKSAWHFQRVSAARRVQVSFVGVWDTVASVLVPKEELMYLPWPVTLPYTRRNPSVQAFRHAIAIDERRRMFRVNQWQEPQPFVENPFDSDAEPVEQDIKQVWFAGTHSDVGGGFPEAQSGLSKYPLAWMLSEAKSHGLKLNTAMHNHLVLGDERKGSRHQYVAPDAEAELHDSMTAGWKPLEWIPKLASLKEWPNRSDRLGLYFPRSEPRPMPSGARIHQSVIQRTECVSGYRPVNMAVDYVVEE